MILEAERREIIRFGKKMLSSGLTTGTGGNLSILNREQNLLAISPSGVEYTEMKPEDAVVLDMAGQIKDGTRKPSSELGFHLALYRKRADIAAVVHTHSVYATTIACLNWEIPAVHYLVGFSGKKVPLAPYATFGTEELARNISETIGDCNAVLMANHGLVTAGPGIGQAFAVAEEIELVAQIWFQTQCVGGGRIISDAEMDRVLEKFKTYGQKAPSGDERS
ncbi:MAG: L-fuculose-phosphate aldolase [Desulfobacterales bacterium]